MVEQLLSNQIEERRNDLTKRLAQVLLDNEPKGKCPRLSNCPYLVDKIKAVNMNVSEAHVYLSIICEQYPHICELNLNSDI